MAGRGRGVGTRFGRANDAEGSSSQAAASVDLMQHQHQYEAYQPQHEQP